MQLKETITKDRGSEPTIEEIAKALEVDKEEIVFSFDAIQVPISLQEPVYKDGTENILWKKKKTQKIQMKNGQKT